MNLKRQSLAGRLKAGDNTAADELVDVYYSRIYLYMRRLGHSRHASEDLTQESFLKAWQHIGQLRDTNAITGWLYRIASNVSNRYWRRNRRRETVNLETFDLPDQQPGGSEKVDDSEQIDKIKDAVVALSAKARQVIILHYMQHLTIAEAAQAAGIRQGTFKSRLSRALNALKERLTSENGELR